MENTTRLSINIDIAAQKIISQIVINNKTIEGELTRSIEKAITELFEVPEHFDIMIKDSIRHSLEQIVKSAVLSYNMKEKITKSLTNIVEDKLSLFADKIGDKLENTLLNELTKTDEGITEK